MLKKLIIPLLLFFPALLKAQEPENNRFLILNESNLRINGTSNITDFSCISEHELEEDTLKVNVQFPEDKIQISESSLILEITDFDCGKKGINRDFRQTLKYREHPDIHISLSSLHIDATKDYPTSATVDIQIAGLIRSYEVPLIDISFGERMIYASGRKLLHMSDFGLRPPSPMFGLIKVGDELQIEFDLVIQELE